MRWTTTTLLALALCCAAAAEDDTHSLLARLGLQRLRVPAAHHRKRLAEQARRHATGDSRMFVIKLPPSQAYYSHAAAAPAAPAALPRALPLALRSNGRPGGVYHWRLPAAPARRRPAGAARLHEHPNALPGAGPAYYSPAALDPSLRKYYAGNGKPKSFYLMDDDATRPVRHHDIRLLP